MAVADEIRIDYKKLCRGSGLITHYSRMHTSKTKKPPTGGGQDLHSIVEPRQKIRKNIKHFFHKYFHSVHSQTVVTKSYATYYLIYCVFGE